jgi:formylglycine-generating enzyme required for sulfatase activity
MLRATRMTTWASVVLGLVACGKQPAGNGGGSAGGAGVVHREPIASASAAGSAATAQATPVDEDPKAPPPPPTVVKQTKGDCKTDYAPRPARDPNPMCKVEGGTFVMGDDKDESPNLKPAHAVKVAPFYIDEFEVTVAQVAFYLNTVKNNDCPTSIRQVWRTQPSRDI